jgi:hypothetical protein
MARTMMTAKGPDGVEYRITKEKQEQQEQPKKQEQQEQPKKQEQPNKQDLRSFLKSSKILRKSKA